MSAESISEYGAFIASRNYWSSKLKGWEHVPCFVDRDVVPGDTAGPVVCCSLSFPAGLHDMLFRVAASPKARHMVLLSALAALASRWGADRQVLIFTPVYDHTPAVTPAIPVLLDSDEALTFPELLQTVRAQLLNDQRYMGCTLDQLLGCESSVLGSFPVTGLVLEEVQQRAALTALSPELVFSFSAGAFPVLDIHYDTQRFGADFIKRLGAHYFIWLEDLLTNGRQKISSANEISLKDRQLLLDWNDTSVPFPHEATLVSLFDQQCALTPDNLAIRWQEERYTYATVQQMANRIAAYLQTYTGVRTGDIVGVLLDRGPFLIPVVLGILKAGAAYAPMDTGYPAERLHTVIRDAGIRVVFTTALYNDRLANLGIQGVDPTSVLEKDEHPAMPAAPCIKGSDVAYVIFTSGSTGSPKGVVVTHSAVVNRLCWMQDQFPLTAEDVLLQKTPVVFDVSVWELFWWAFSGASVCMLAPGAEKDPQELLHTIIAGDVSVVHFVPSMLDTFVSWLSAMPFTAPGKLRIVFCSGEALKVSSVQRFKQVLSPQGYIRLVNLYGPTEATVDVSFFECSFDPVPSDIPIGKPIHNTRFYILNRYGQPCPIGIAGELCIAGVGLARGYLNKPDQTALKFIQHPGLSSERIYRTGDLARWLPDGNMLYLGRIDDQVKIRGLRIELGEIEFHLAAFPGIQSCVVVVRTRHETDYLVAYYISAAPITSAAIRSYLEVRLPDYMVPVFYVACDVMPLTTSGKLDRKALPDPWLQEQAAYVAPVGKTAERLTEIWASVLKIAPAFVSADRSFFEMGGSSLKVVELSLAIRREMGVEVSVPDIFRSHAIALLAAFIDGNDPGTETYKANVSTEVEDMQAFINLFDNSK